VALQVSIRESADVTILELRGRSTVNGGESESLSRQLKKLVTDSVCKLLLNVRDLTQVDSSGVSVIVGTYVSLKRRGGDLKLLHPSGRVLDVLTVFHLTGAIPIFEDEAEALDSFQSRAFSATP
jgi:anti-anti-sigma factor